MPLFKIGAGFIASGMTAGAFGAHALKGALHGEKTATWQTASNYLIFNGVALLALSQSPYARRKAPLFIATGAVLFSGSIFALLTTNLPRKVLGPITPLGGLLMIGGYASLLL